METRNPQSDSTSLLTKNINECGNSSADENAATKKKSKKRDRSPNTDNVLSDNAIPASPTTQSNQQAQTNVQQQKKEKQRPETWNKLEQQIFFNALRQNGKNFESITQYFNARQKRFKVDDGVYVQRSKEQIRHFYYRTWHKIIKYISIPFHKNKNTTVPGSSQVNSATASVNNNTNNNSQTTTPANSLSVDSTGVLLRDIQVKCLIAFNVLMTKLHRWNKKSALKLVELINQGWTTIREKGKVTRIKMPICKDSTKTVQSGPETTATDEKDPNPIPHIININLEPKNENAYCKVHRLAQTPFLNIEIQTMQSVKYLIEFLENKWKNRRNQFLEKFQISKPKTFSNIAESTSELHDQENESGLKKNNSDNDSLSNSSVNFFEENLVLYPNEDVHQINSINLIENLDKNTPENQNESDLQTHSPTKIAESSKICAQNANDTILKTNLIQRNLMIGDETMMIDDYALISANTPKNNKPKNIEADPNSSQLQADQLRAGLTASNTKIIPEQNKEKKYLTFKQLYLAFNKPEKICLKYDWISANRKMIDNHHKGLSLCSATSPSFCSFDFGKNQRQRFYIETLANVASSYLNDIRVSKTNSMQINNQELEANNSQNKSNNKATPKVSESASKSTSTSILQNKQQEDQSIIQKSPPKAMNLVQSSTVTSISQKKQDMIQIPTDLNVQRQNDEQNIKTKKLLSDLNSRRRSRQRKQIMVVNTSNNQSPRNILLPKLNLNMDLNQISCHVSPQSSNNSNNSVVENPQQQNIVCSGPLPAVARQIVNNSSLLTFTPPHSSNSPLSTNEVQINHLESQQQKIQPNSSSNVNNTNNNQVEIRGNNQVSKVLNTNQSIQSTSIPSFQHAFSNFIPNFLTSITDNSSSNEENDLKNEINDKQNLTITNNPTDTLTDMSLLDLSINNTDSLLAATGITQPKELNTEISDINNLNNNVVIGAFSSVSDKSEKNCLDRNEIASSNMIPSYDGSSLIKNGSTNINANQTPGFSLVHKKSDICEWTDSMNDVSLTGILTDMQSPIKQPNNIDSTVYNENSDNSIYITMDTIMEIMPSSSNRFDPNRFDENSLIPSLTTNERATSNLQN